MGTTMHTCIVVIVGRVVDVWLPYGDRSGPRCAECRTVDRGGTKEGKGGVSLSTQQQAPNEGGLGSRFG